MVPTLLYADDRCLGHETPPSHPESPARLRAILDSLRKSPIPGTRFARAEMARKEDLLLVHDESYVDGILSSRGQSAMLDSDTWLSPGSVDAALLAAGAAIAAVDAVCTGEARTAFSLCRPPGHHAERGEAMGFCIFNNVAIAAAHAAARLGRERILLVDWDVHHGNGTQQAFWEREDVLFFSTHRSPFYPQTGFLEEIGAGAGEGATVNVPLPGGLGDADFVAIFQELLEPIADEYRPDLVLVSAGFDTHEDDPLGGMAVSSEGFGALARILRGIADRHADGRLALVLEGGYDLAGLVGGVRSCTEVLCAPSVQMPPKAQPGAAGRRAIDEAKAFHSRHRARGGRLAAERM